MRTRPGRSILSIICLCLFLSGLIRVGIAGAALANASPGSEQAPPSQSDFSAQTNEMTKLMEELQERSAALDEREQQISVEEEKIRNSQTQIVNELKKLEAAEQSLLSTIARVKSASAKDIANLTAVYEAMKPKDAALLFEKMNPDFAAGFLSEMAPTSAAGIMSGLTSEKAYEISVVLAGRNSSTAQP